VSDHTAARLRDVYRLRCGDILLVRVGDTKRFVTVTDKEAGWLMGNTCIRLRPRPEREDRYNEKVTPEFLAWYLSQAGVQGWLNAHTLHGSRSSINKGNLGQLPLVLPSEAIQRRIACHSSKRGRPCIGVSVV
jgi:type I restriction enzyme S subunit